MTTATERNKRPKNKHLRLFHLVRTLQCWRNTLQLEWSARHGIKCREFKFKVANVLNPHSYFAEEGTKLCRTCSTRVFPYSTNQILHL